MAVSWIQSRNSQPNISISKCVSIVVDYSKNRDKTQDYEYVTGYECSPQSAEKEFMLSIKNYERNTGRTVGKGNNTVITYHFMQSFAPGEVTPELANKIGYDTANELTGGNFQYIVGTHTDKNHIHNHIIICACNIDGTRKYKNEWNSFKKIRKISDKHCKLNNVSIIDNPQVRDKDNKDLFPGEKSSDTRNPTSWKKKLENAILFALSKEPKDFDEFLKLMEDNGYEIKKGKHLAFKLKDGQQKFTRLSSLDEDFSEESIRYTIDYINDISEDNQAKYTPNKTSKKTIGMQKMIDIKNSKKAKSSIGYKNWAHGFNVKQITETRKFMKYNGLIGYEEIAGIYDECERKIDELKSMIKEIEQEQKENSELQNAIFDYRRTKDVFDEYKASKYDKKFYKEHEEIIEKHRATKKVFNSLNTKKLPTIKQLKAEYSEKKEHKNELYAELEYYKDNLKNYEIAKYNMAQIYDIRDEPVKEQREQNTKNREER